MNRLRDLLIAVLAVIGDEELLGMYLEEIVHRVINPIVYVYVLGTYAAEYKNTIVQMIEPKTPDFSISHEYSQHHS